MNNFTKLYCYDSNEDLVLKLCKKFELNEPKIRANYYGSVDVIFESGLKVYCVQVQDNKVVLSRRELRNFGQKNTKEHMRIIKEYIDGNIWYEILKKISKDSKL